MEGSRGLPRGRKVAGYQLEREIGRAATSVVYRAEDLGTGRTVALKMLAPEDSHDDALRRIAHASRAAMALDHPNIVPVFEVGEAEGVGYIAMLYVPGPDLRTMLDEVGPLPMASVLRIAAQVASALDAAHGRGLIHRGVRPSNILVAAGTDRDAPERTYLTGFGLTEVSPASTGSTTAAALADALNYLAPEQIAERVADSGSDLYSLACVVYEAIAGVPPFEHVEYAAAVSWARHYNAPPAISGKRRGVAPGVDAVMARALAKRSEDRYASGLDFVAALDSAAVRPSSPMVGSPPPPSGQRDGAAYGTPPGPPLDDDDDEW